MTAILSNHRPHNIHPCQKEPGLLDTVVNGVNSVLNPVASGVTCAATNLIADEKLKDEAFIRSQMDCAMGRGPCDEVGKKIKCKSSHFSFCFHMHRQTTRDIELDLIEHKV